MVFDTKPNAEFLVSGIVELFPIVGNDDLGNPKSADDRVPSEVSNIPLGGFC